MKINDQIHSFNHDQWSSFVLWDYNNLDALSVANFHGTAHFKSIDTTKNITASEINDIVSCSWSKISLN